ncbi:hypothetical protein [Acidisarcina polymorpha]|nr:hypothetical protein [Acidisarcina polymorpha]
MTRIPLPWEPYEISARFYRALQARALTLEIDALGDELQATTIENPDQLRRHRLLARAQRDEAERYRDFLTRTSIRTATATHSTPLRSS